MKNPLVVQEFGGDVMVFERVETLESALEAIDVRNGEYRAFDADGQVLELSVEKRVILRRPWFLGGNWTADFVCVSDTGKIQREELKEVLGTFLQRTSRIHQKSPKSSLDELIEIVVREFGHDK